ncbi:outer membrane biogenesis protein BamB [Stieleria maiorica]|uniref:Outer membrane biogenesis protein BamB n=1 Tax=Stieleria maiorica TaxID=2795974 RepID=A0A5B9MAG6_9BACT|nr:PQQ-binding-like beta-propeller repeat protein [Stieleria maiorica]QEF97060.1 outer membrane biogenesis protein BamB [Stieleria maiorica]
MKRITHLTAMVLLALGLQHGALVDSASVNCAAGELMSPQTASRLGLEEVWRRQMRVPAGAGSIVDQQIIVHEADPREYVEVVTKAAEGEQPTVMFRIPTDQVGPDGQPIGKEEAERLARREVRRLARRKLDLSITSSTVPRIKLYTAANNGTLECRDAETGTPIWMSQVGDPQLNFGRMGIDDEFVTITNGGNLVKIDATNGEPINSVRTTSMPLYGAIHAGDFSLVPTIRNGVEGYPLADTTRDPFMEIVSGLALEPPTKSPTSTKVAWATDRGFVYVMELSGEPSVLFRLNTDGIVSGRIAAADGDRFFFGSESGQVYGLRATRTGRVLWSQPYGEPFYKAPFLVNGMVLLPSAYGNLYAIDEKTGLGVWDQPIPNVDEIIGGFDQMLFVRLLSQSFAAIDLETGSVIEVDNTLKPVKLLVNRTTDRLYLVNAIGTVQCLRAIGADNPTIRRAVDTGDPEEAEEATEKPEAEAPKAAPADPFGAGGDPFGAGGADPFGAGGADPFGAGDAGGGEMADPFGAPAGGGNDPFGGDPFGN